MARQYNAICGTVDEADAGATALDGDAGAARTDPGKGYVIAYSKDTTPVL